MTDTRLVLASIGGPSGSYEVQRLTIRPHGGDDSTIIGASRVW